MKLGINGMGRIGKLSLWNHVAKKHFSEIVVNVGREVGEGLTDLVQTLEKDSTFGNISTFLRGYHGGQVIENLDLTTGRMTVDGVPVRFLRQDRNPKDISWRNEGVSLVVDCTGVFTDPTDLADVKGGALRGHLEAGATKVLLSAPFKAKNKGLPTPPDAITTVLGINDNEYESSRHALISAASCTTTCLAYMMKPLLDFWGADRILSASMVTVHAATASQKVLDSIPKAGAKDLRKTRSVMNNMILTTTGAADALRLVIPEMKKIGFMAESIRVPITSGSLIILTLNLQSEDGKNPINRDHIREIYRDAASGPCRGFLEFSEAQNVSSDIIGYPKAAVVIEGREIHTRTAFTRVNLDQTLSLPESVRNAIAGHTLEVPVTQAVVYGWYDNELGSYAFMLGELAIQIANSMN